MSETSALYRYSAAIQGFLLWSCWAFYVNSKVSLAAGIVAGLVQGLFSFFATLVVISLLTRLYNYIESKFLKLFIPPIIMLIGLTTILVIAHTIARTPKIIETISPSLIIAAFFCSFTIYKLDSAKTM